jgi:hypothetical protein
MADVGIASVFSCYFFVDDPPRSAVLEKYPHAARYLTRICGMRELLSDGVTEECGSSDPAKDGAARQSSPGNGVGYEDVVPESLADLFVLMEEAYLTFAVEMRYFSHFMTTEAHTKLKTEVIRDGPLSGCKGFLFNRSSPIFWVMAIDSQVIMLRSRPEEVQKMLHVAREVVGLDFPSILDVANEKDTASNSPDSSAMSMDEVDPRIKRAVAALSERSSDVADHVDRANGRGIPVSEAIDVAFLKTERISVERFKRPKRDVLAEKLMKIRRILMDIHNPHFTIVTVPRSLVAETVIVPEHEIAKVKS